MEPQFWLRKWQANEIGFHQSDVHPLLLAHWPALACLPDQRVLVPLCGKSCDMEYLAARGLAVLGFELSELAAQAFFAERGRVPRVDTVAGFRRYFAEHVTIYCGDFFAATPALCPPCDALYDRAALIALAPAQRAAYLALVRDLLRPHAQGLLITVEYPEERVKPPPFSVPCAEVARRCGEWAEVRELERRASDIKGYPGVEVAYRLDVRGS